MEIWLDNLGITADAEQAQSMYKVSRGKNLDVIFVVYSNAGFLKYTKAELIDAASAIFEEAEKQNVTARLHFVAWTGGIYPNNNSGTYYAENIEDATAMINSSVSINTANFDPTVYMLTKAITGIRENMTEDFLENSEKYCFIIDSGCSPACSTTHGGIKALKDTGMDFSFVYSPFNTNAANYSALSSNNSVHQMVAGNGRLAFWEFIFEHLFDVTDEPFKIISSAGLVELPNDFGDISLDSDQDYDNDGLLDAEEIYFDATDKSGKKLVTINANNTISLPNFNECVAVGGTYIESGLDRFYDEADESILNELDSIMVLPIMSDPTSEDGDGDGILDLTEYRIMQKVKNSAVAFTAENNENNEAVSTDEMINAAKTNTIVDFSKQNSIVKRFAPSDKEIQPDKPYTLAYDNDIKIFKQSRYNGEVMYSILGEDTDTYYLEFCSKFNDNEKIENYLRINVNMKFSDNLNFDSEGNLKKVELVTYGTSESEIDESDSSKIVEYINRDELVKSIKDKWGGIYEGNNYDFYKGMNVDVSVRINIIDEVDSENSETQYSRTIDNNQKEKAEYDGSFATINLDTNNEDNPTTNMGLESSKNPIVFIFTNRKQTSNSKAKTQNKNQIESILAHEFGHVLGLMDAYGYNSNENYFVEPVSFAEIQYTMGEDIYGTEAAGEMMHRNGVVTANDIEMVIYAKKTGEFQFFVPIGKINNKDGYKLSQAIRANYIYHVANGNKPSINVDAGCYYYYKYSLNKYDGKGTYVKITPETDISESGELYATLIKGDENHKDEYLQYINYIISILPKEKDDGINEKN